MTRRFTRNWAGCWLWLGWGSWKIWAFVDVYGYILTMASKYSWWKNSILHLVEEGKIGYLPKRKERHKRKEHSSFRMWQLHGWSWRPEGAELLACRQGVTLRREIRIDDFCFWMLKSFGDYSVRAVHINWQKMAAKIDCVKPGSVFHLSMLRTSFFPDRRCASI